MQLVCSALLCSVAPAMGASERVSVVVREGKREERYDCCPPTYLLFFIKDQALINLRLICCLLGEAGSSFGR